MDGLRLAVAWLVTAALLVGLAGAGIQAAVDYFSGEPATAVIDGCTTTAESRERGMLDYHTTCTGHWTLADGRSGRGTVIGIDNTNSGEAVHARVTGSEARVRRLATLWPLGLFILVLPAVAAFAVRALRHH